MKYLKIIFKIFSELIMILTIIILFILELDTHNTKYLKLENNPNLNKTSFIITKVNVIPMSKDTVLKNKTVFVKNGIIKNISDSINVSGVEIINGNGQFLSPGLIDMHVHVWDKYELGLYIANGVTAVRNLWGMPEHLRMKKETKRGIIIAPIFFTSSPKLTGQNDYGDDKVQISSPEKAKKLVASYKKRGYDFIKTYAGLPENIDKAIIEQARISNISIVSHPSREIPYLNQFNPQIKSLEHAEEIVQQALGYKLDSLKLDTIIQKFVQTKMSFCPTLIGYYNIYEMLNQNDGALKLSGIHYMNPFIQQFDSKVQYNRWANEKKNNSAVTKNILKQHKFHLYIVKKMNDAGVNIICGTDAGIGITVPGKSIHQELAFYREAGLSNYDALKTATINPSKAHKEFEQMGTIEKGKFANFILTSENPLKDLSILENPEWVMIKGRKIDNKLLKEFISNARDRKDLMATGLRYAEYMLVER